MIDSSHAHPSAGTRAAQALEAHQEALAVEITGALYAEMPELLTKYGERGREKCLQDRRYNLEHLATAITQAAMARLFDAAVPGMNGSAPTLIAACADVERHEIGLRMVCDLLELEGWDTSFLGATVPIERLVEMVRRRRPEVVALSASLPPHLPRLRAMVETVRGALPDQPPLIVVGGRPFLEHHGDGVRVESSPGEEATFLFSWSKRS